MFNNIDIYMDRFLFGDKGDYHGCFIDLVICHLDGIQVTCEAYKLPNMEYIDTMLTHQLISDAGSKMIQRRRPKPTQGTQNICITFIQRRRRWYDIV